MNAVKTFFFISGRYWLLILGGFALFLVGVVVGRGGTTQPFFVPSVLRENGYSYIHPVLLCNTSNTSNIPENVSLSNKIKEYIERSPEKDVGVFYLDPETYAWASVNGNESFSPASMLKVPAMVALLRYADSHPGFLSKQMFFDGSFDDNKAEFFKPLQVLAPLHSYTVEELIEYMIEYSDNNAARLLNSAVEPRFFDGIYTDLGLQIPSMAGPIDFMSPRTYSLFLRLLYNSTYLSRDLSEKALTLMAYQDFPQGLQAGVPPSVTVAQKFGERQIFRPDGKLVTRELHDCGIVYQPKHPYILCVMTRGSNFNVLASEIADISKIVYSSMND